MDIKNRILTLYQKLKDESITRSEYEEFLSYSQDDGLRNILDGILDEELKDKFSQKNPDRTRVPKKRPLQRLAVIGSIAASFLVLIVAGIIILKPSDKPDIQYTTSNGETLEVLLPDSSVIKLNANSSLVWIASGDESLREVRLSGEAFFDVYSMPEKPFRVYSNEMVIEVLGTSFNLNNRENKDEVFLEEGAIRINNPKNMEDTLLLIAGEAAFFNAESHKVVKTSDSRFEDQARWKDGILKFRNLAVREILKEVEYIYGVELQLNDEEMMGNPMDFALPYSNWEVVSQALALALGTELIEYEDHYEFVRK